MSVLLEKLNKEFRQETNGGQEAIKARRLMSKDDLEYLAALSKKLDGYTTQLFTKLTHDDTGRYSDDGGIHFNAAGLERQEIILTACNHITKAMDLLKIY